MYKSIIFLVLLLVAIGVSTGYGTDRIHIDDRRSPRFLPYSVQQLYGFDYGVSRKPPLVAVRPYRPEGSRQDRALLASVANTPINVDGPASIVIFNYLTSRIISQDPVYATITDFTVYTGPSSDTTVIIGLCYRNDSAYVIRNRPGTDEFDFLYLTSGTDRTGNGFWQTSIETLLIEDYDYDGHNEAFVYLNPGRDLEPRVLFCIDLDSFNIEWSLPVASFCGRGWLSSCRDSTDPGVIFVTYGPQNGVKDQNFDDYYGYLSRVDGEGRLVFNRPILRDYAATQLYPLNDEHTRFCLYHNLPLSDTLKITNLPAATGRLSIINRDGEIERSIPSGERLSSLWRCDYRRHGARDLYTLWEDGRVKIYDTSLALLAESGRTRLQRYMNTLKIVGRSDSVFAFLVAGNSELYSHDFKRLAEIESMVGVPVPVLTDTAGAASQLLIASGEGGAVVGLVRRGTMTIISQLISANQQYLIGALFVLMLALVVVNSFRTRALRKLHVREREIRTVFDHMEDCYYRANNEGVIVWASPSTFRLLGVKSDAEAAEVSATKFYARPEERQELLETLKRTGRVTDYEVELRGTDGRIIVVSTNSTFWRDENGKVLGVEGIFRDITARRRIEEALRESEGKYRSVIEQSSDNIYLADVETGKILEANPALQKTLGYSADELTQMTVFDFIDHAEEDVRDKIERASAGELSYLAERKYRRRDGSRLDVEVSVGKMMYRGKKTLCVISRDVTERRRAQRAIEENEAKYRTLVESAGEAIFTITRDGEFLFVNSIGADRLGLTPEQIIGKNMRDIFPLELGERQLATVQRIFDSGEGETVESVTSIRGSERRYRTSIQPIRDNSGKVVAALGIARDTTEIMLTRAELEQERDFVRSLLDTANSLIVCLDSEARITVFNRECERLTGYSRDEVLGRRWPELFLPPEARHDGLTDFGHWVHEHPEDMYEGPLVTKSGEIRTILWSNSALFSSNMDGLTAIAVGQDITERKRAQEALQESERRYALATAAAKVGVWDYNIETGEFYVDPAITIGLGYRDHEKINNRSQWIQLIYEEDRESAIEAARAHIAGETPEFVHEHRFIAKDGSLRWMLARGHVIHSHDGKPVRMVGTDTDITERKEAEENLREAEERFGELVQTMSDGLGVIDERDKITYVNERFCEMLGYSREELLGRVATTLSEPSHRGTAQDQFRKRSRGEREAYETVMVRSDGRRVNVIVSPAPLFDAEGEFRGSVAVFTDITERMQAEHLLRLQRDFGIALSLAKDLPEVLEKLLDVCLEVEGVDCGGVYILDESSGCLELGAYRNLSDKFVEEVRRYEPSSMQMKLVMEGKPVYSLCSDAPFSEIGLFREEGLKSLAIIPVLFERRVLAVLNLASHSMTHIPSGIRNSLETFAGRIAGIITRLRTESALRESESKFRELADLLPQTVYEVDAELNITYVNRQGLQMFGLTPELLEKGVNGLHMFVPEDRKRLEENVRRAFQRENLGGIDYTATRVDGRTFPVIVYAEPVMHGDTVHGLRGIVIDVTERKQAEEAIREGEERARAQYKSIPVPTYTWRWEGDDFVLMDYNHKAVEITNGTITNLVGIKFKDMYPHWPETFQDMMKSLKERTIVKREMVYHFQTTGMDRILDVSYAYVPPNMVTVHTVDITERKEAEERLKYRVKLEELVATISTKFINLFSDEIDGGIEYALKSLSEFARVDRSCVCQFFDNQSVMTTTHEWSSNRVDSLPGELRAIPTAGIPWMMTRIRRGEVFVVPGISVLPAEAEIEKLLMSSRGIVSMIMVPMTYAGRLIGVLSLDSVDADRSWREEDVLLVRMVSEILVSALQRKRTEQELDRINKEKVAQAKQMAGGFAHEIRNALFPARGSVDRMNQMLSKPNPKLASLRKYPQIADRSVSRALDITALISRYTKLDSERFPERVNLKAVINEVLANNQLLLKEREVEVSVSGIVDSMVESNRAQLYMVINNLLINSVDAMEETAKPAITITGESASMGVKLLFTDNGCGISPQEIDRVFEAFYSTKPEKGTGIGLATAKKIVEMYGGFIRVRSEAGKGTTFEIILRQSAESAESK